MILSICQQQGMFCSRERARLMSLSRKLLAEVVSFACTND
jgi:hypothetical protein